MAQSAASADKTLNPPGTATPMRPRPFLLLLAGFALALAFSSVPVAAHDPSTFTILIRDDGVTPANASIRFNDTAWWINIGEDDNLTHRIVYDDDGDGNYSGPGDWDSGNLSNSCERDENGTKLDDECQTSFEIGFNGTFGPGTYHYQDLLSNGTTNNATLVVTPDVHLVSDGGGGGTEPLELEEICLGNHSGLAQHIHIMLVILDNGTSLTIPANTGIDTDVCPNGMHAIHTHDTSGKLHIETPDSTPVYLGTFFNIWGQPFTAEQVMHMVADANHTLTMKVDGVVYDSWELTLLADQQVIVVEYQAAGGNGTGDSPVNNTGDPPVDDTSNPPANDTTEEKYDTDDDTRLPATSLLTTLVAMAIIALKRRRSD